MPTICRHFVYWNCPKLVDKLQVRILTWQGESKTMPIVQILVVLIIVGFLLWLVQTTIPMEPAVKRIITAVVVFLLVIWIVTLIFPSLTSWRIRT